MRFVPWRTPPSSWARDFSPASAVFVLVLWPGLWVLGPVGLAAAGVAAIVWALMRSTRGSGTTNTSYVLHSCGVCGSDTISPSRLCPAHREPTASVPERG